MVIFIPYVDLSNECISAHSISMSVLPTVLHWVLGIKL